MLREVKPNYMENDFVNSFLNLPQSFFSPRAPQKFQRFIQKFGTHYVKAAKFGGSFKVLKTRKITSTADIQDFRKEIQKEMNKMVGNTVIQARSAKAENSQSHSGIKAYYKKLCISGQYYVLGMLLFRFLSLETDWFREAAI